jgi:hypothetical protein
MLGVNLALVTGLHRRYGWPIVAVAAASSALPDWDGFSLLLGGQAYARVHRVWGHNLLVASATGVGASVAGFSLQASGYFQRITALSRFPDSAAVQTPTTRTHPFTFHDVIICIAVGTISSLSHLAVDLVYSGHPQLTSWPLLLLWPFSNKPFVYPIVPYGDLGATLIFVVEMFCLYGWRARAQILAAVTLILVLIYIGVRWSLIAGLS